MNLRSYAAWLDIVTQYSILVLYGRVFLFLVHVLVVGVRVWLQLLVLSTLYLGIDTTLYIVRV